MKQDPKQEHQASAAPETESAESTDTLKSEITEENLSLKSIFFRMFLGLVILAVVLALAGAYFREPLMKISKTFVNAVGGPGIAVGWFLIDGVAFPFPNDVLSFFGVQGGMSFAAIVFWSSLGSVGGGAFGFWIGSRLRNVQWFVDFIEGRGAEAYLLVKRYGYLAIGLGAFTPVPYSFCAWTGGMIRLNFGAFLLLSLLRIPRVLVYLYLIKLGFKVY